MLNTYKRGRSGSKLKEEVLQNIFEVMTNPKYDGVTQKELAENVGISVRCLRNYLTETVWEEIRTLRLDVMQQSLMSIDKAIYTKAAGGDVSAAKLIYSRWEQEAKNSKLAATKHAPRTLEEINAELKRLREEIHGLEHKTPYVKSEAA